MGAPGTAVACTMARPGGRIARVIVGIVISAVGVLALHGTARIVVGLVGLVPILAGLVNVCALSVLLGGPLSGKRALAQQARHGR
jgi:uncharacterized membrane protein YkgB